MTRIVIGIETERRSAQFGATRTYGERCEWEAERAAAGAGLL